MHVPGYAGAERVCALGGAWQARDAATGEPVLLRFVAAPPARLRPVRLLDVPGLLPIRHVAAVAGGCVVVYEFRPPGAVDSAALAEILDAVHQAGFTHGALDSSYVFAGPSLGGVGLAEAAGEIVETADDFHALAELRDPHPEPEPARRSFPVITLTAAVAVFVASLLFALPRPARQDWKAVLTRLDVLRVQAFETGDLTTLRLADTGEALRRDTVTLQRLRGHRVTGLRFALLSVSGAAPQLHVRDVMSSYHIDTVAVPSRGIREWVLYLQRTRYGWRIASVVGA